MGQPASLRSGMLLDGYPFMRWSLIRIAQTLASAAMHSATSVVTEADPASPVWAVESS